MDAEKYLHLLDGSTDKFLFACFDYRKEKKPKILYGTYKDNQAKLQAFNSDVFCVYVTINETESNSRSKDSIARCRAIWVEDDVPVDEPRSDFPLPPSMIVESSPGKYHYYWLTSTDDFSEWNAVMQTMVDVWGCDNKARDISRVLRLPGFKHRKDLASNFTTQLISAPGTQYDWETITAAFPPTRSADSEAEGGLGYAESEAIEAILNSTNYHGSLTSIAMSLSNRGMSRELQLFTLRGLMLSIPKAKRRPEWDDRISDEHLYECIDSGIKKEKDESVDVESLPDEDEATLANYEFEFPPGFAGQICTEINEMAAYENRAIALAGGIGLMAGIVGRRYNVNGMGLNIYIALLADSGMGKANLKDSINKALRGNGGNLNLGATFVGKSRFTGPKPVFEMLSTGLSRICVLEEAGLMSESQAGDQAGISRVTLDLFTSSGEGKWAGDEGYSKKEESIPVLPSPALSIIQVSTPKSFLKALKNKSAQVSGEIARLWMIRAIGEKPYLNRNRRMDFSKETNEKIDALLKICHSMQLPNSTEKPICFEVREEHFDDADEWVKLENKFIREGDHLRRTLCSRAWAKTIKLAAICSAFNGLDYIGQDEYKWARDIVNGELGFIQNTFTHESSDDLLELVKSVMLPSISKILKAQFKDPLKVPPLKVRKKGIFSYTNIAQTLRNNLVLSSIDDNPEKQNPKTGLEKVIEYMLRAGLLVKVETNELVMLGTKIKKAYKITHDFELLMSNF